MPNVVHMPRIKPDLIGTAEASKLTGLDKRTIQRMVIRGELTPAHKMDGLRGALVFRRVDVEALAPTPVA